MTTTTAPAAARDYAAEFIAARRAVNAPDLTFDERCDAINAGMDIADAARQVGVVLDETALAARASAPARLTITGDDAREIRSHVNAYIRPLLGSQWVEVQAMRECQHGCKLHVRQRGAARQYALLHYTGYGCKLGRDEATRIVPVSLRPAA